MDDVLSLAVLPIVGNCVLLLDIELTTVGYGDVVLSQMWRTLGPVESVLGVLMTGLSVSVLFSIMTRLVEREVAS